MESQWYSSSGNIESVVGWFFMPFYVIYCFFSWQISSFFMKAPHRKAFCFHNSNISLFKKLVKPSILTSKSSFIPLLHISCSSIHCPASRGHNRCDNASVCSWVSALDERWPSLNVGFWNLLLAGLSGQAGSVVVWIQCRLWNHFFSFMTQIDVSCDSAVALAAVENQRRDL